MVFGDGDEVMNYWKYPSDVRTLNSSYVIPLEVLYEWTPVFEI